MELKMADMPRVRLRAVGIAWHWKMWRFGGERMGVVNDNCTALSWFMHVGLGPCSIVWALKSGCPA